MKLNTIKIFALGFTFLSTSAALAGEKIVTLKVDGMTCASCPYQVKAALKKVEGVESATVSIETSEAVVSFDDSQTSVASLTEATTNAGFPSEIISSN
jgi:mercuric ion binding protein